MRLLGAIFAGGRSSRFGSDKAVALLGGRRLIDLVHARLAEQTDAVVVCGGVRAGFVCVPDRPAPDLGPLGGLAGALHHAATNGFDAVLTAPCEAVNLPAGLAAILGDAPAYLADCPVVGLWPSALGPALDRHLASSSERSVRRWAASCGARTVAAPIAIDNINTPEDLASLARRHAA